MRLGGRHRTRGRCASFRTSGSCPARSVGRGPSGRTVVLEQGCSGSGARRARGRMERYAGGVVHVPGGRACVRAAGAGPVGVPVCPASIRTVARGRNWRGAVSASLPASDCAHFHAQHPRKLLFRFPAPVTAATGEQPDVKPQVSPSAPLLRAAVESPETSQQSPWPTDFLSRPERAGGGAEARAEAFIYFFFNFTPSARVHVAIHDSPTTSRHT